jgi:hypothetical protein
MFDIVLVIKSNLTEADETNYMLHLNHSVSSKGFSNVIVCLAIGACWLVP